MSILATEIWRIGVVKATIQQIATTGSVAVFPIKWIEADRKLCFLADPFGIWREEKLYLFAEAYDYRTRRGNIVAYVLDADLNILEYRTVLDEPWHLSYPYVFEAQGEIWMLPEGYKSGQLSLYRATDFPWQWQQVPEFSFPCAAIDPSPFFYANQWWMFYTPPTPREARTQTLMLATANHLFGPWKNVSDEPIRQDKRGARMGGTPFLHEDTLFLPTQDCYRTYGGALQLLTLAPEKLANPPALELAAHLEAPRQGTPYTDGFHTLASAGTVTLIDSKRTLYGSPQRLTIEAARLWRKWRA